MFFSLAALPLATALLGAAPQLPADPAAAVEAGRTAGRTLLVFRDARACAIPLLRARCRTDVDAFIGARTDADFQSIPKVGKHPITGLRAFIDTGDRDALDLTLVYLNETQATTEQWATDARASALYDAGITVVLFPAAAGNPVMQYLSLGALLDLGDHASLVPAGALPIALPTPAPSSGPLPVPGAQKMMPDVLGFTARLDTAIDGMYPPPSLFGGAFAHRPLTDAQLGVASITILELIDSPDWLAQTDSQEFVHAFISAAQTQLPGVPAAPLATLQSATRVDEHFDHDKANAAHGAAIAALFVTLPADRKRRILLGQFASQLSYNAAVYRDPAAGATFRRIIGSFSDLDGSITGFASARAQATMISATDWPAQYRLGNQLVALILNSGAP